MEAAVGIAYAFDCAVAMIFGWAFASVLTGAASMDWLSSDHQRSPIGLSRVLPAWLLGWPLSTAFKAAASLQVSGTFMTNVQGVASDGAGLLLVVAFWRACLLARANRW